MTHYLSHELIEVGQSVNGTPLTINVTRVNGTDIKAPTTFIQASLHGAEIQGNAVIYWLLEEFKQKQPLGSFVLVPHCNPLAANLKLGEYTYGRFDPIMGDNWNRLFHYRKGLADNFVKSLKPNAEYGVIQQHFRQELLNDLQQKCQNPWGLSIGQLMVFQLQLLAHEADIVLDLHTGNSSAEHLYVPTYARHSAQYFHIAQHLLMDNDFAGSLDEASYCPWWDLADALLAKGYKDIAIPVEAFTVELGSQEVMDLHLGQQQAAKILNYLRHKGAVLGESNLLKQYSAAHVRDYKTFFAPYGGLYEFAVEPGAIMKKGDLLATCLHHGKLIPIYMPEAAVLVLHFDSAAIPQGAELAKFLTNVEFHS